MEKLIGREEEKIILQETLKSRSPELVAIFGRRRVGKTFLVRRTLAKEIVFEFTGTKDVSAAQQLANFAKALRLASGNDNIYRSAENWSIAFDICLDDSACC